MPAAFAYLVTWAADKVTWVIEIVMAVLQIVLRHRQGKQ